MSGQIESYVTYIRRRSGFWHSKEAQNPLWWSCSVAPCVWSCVQWAASSPQLWICTPSSRTMPSGPCDHHRSLGLTWPCSAKYGLWIACQRCWIACRCWRIVGLVNWIACRHLQRVLQYAVWSSILPSIKHCSKEDDHLLPEWLHQACFQEAPHSMLSQSENNRGKK